MFVLVTGIAVGEILLFVMSFCSKCREQIRLDGAGSQTKSRYILSNISHHPLTIQNSCRSALFRKIKYFET